MENKLNDSSLMPYGKYRGIRMIDIPASYFIFLWENSKFLFPKGKAIKAYIEENLEAIKLEQRRNLKDE